MSKFDRVIQFYATPTEMATWTSSWVQEHQLNYVFARLYFRGNPPKFEMAKDTVWTDLSAVAQTIRDYSSLYLSTNAIDTDVLTISQIDSKNRDVLRIELPNVTYRGLTHCFSSSASEVAASLQTYRAIARDIVSRTNEGVWFCQEGRKKVRIHAGMRYSPGAAVLLDQGVPLCGGGRMVVGRLGLAKGRRSGRRTGS